MHDRLAFAQDELLQSIDALRFEKVFKILIFGLQNVERNFFKFGLIVQPPYLNFVHVVGNNDWHLKAEDRQPRLAVGHEQLPVKFGYYVLAA